MRNYTLEEFAKKQAEMTGMDLEITLDGKELTSREGNKKCVYYQLLDHTMLNDKSYRTYVVNISSQEFSMNTKTGKIKVTPANTLRLFVSPAIIKEETVDGGTKQTQLYCLEKGRKYYARIEPETIEFGPPQENGTRMSSTYIFVKISDAPFKNGSAQKEESPAFRNYVYG